MNQPVAAATSVSLKERVGWRAERRPEPGFAHTLGAGAAAFAVFAVFALIIEITSDDATAPGVGFYLALSVVALLAGAQMAGPVRAAAVTTLVLSMPLIWFFAFVGDGEGGTGTLRMIYILVIAGYFALYLLSWTKGHAIFLGLALLILVGWITAEVGGLDRSAVPFQSSFEQNSDVTFNSNDGSLFEDDDNKTTETSTTSLVIGLAYLGAAAALDRKKLAGAATPFIAVGALATISGAIVLGADESLLAGGLAAAASGAVVGLVGGFGIDRRASTWFGVLFVVGGLTAVVADIADSALGFAGLFALVAVLLGAAAWYAAPRLAEFVDGDINAPKTG